MVACMYPTLMTLVSIFSSLPLQINEAKRVLSIEHSGTPGGDGTALKMYATSLFAHDIAGVGMVPVVEVGLVVQEIPDTITPTVVYGEINYDTGVMVLQHSQTVDSTPASR